MTITLERIAAAKVASNLKIRREHDNGAAEVLAAVVMAKMPRANLLFELWRDFGEVYAAMKRIDPTASSKDARLAALTRMRHLSKATLAAEDMVVEIAERIGIRAADHDIQNVAWQGLSVWLDDKCGHCEGRGFSGGYSGVIQRSCTHCKASGRRRGNTGKSDAEILLIERLAMECEAEIRQLSGATRRCLGE